MFKIVDDTHKSLRNVCLEVDKPYSQEIKNTVLEMIDYLKLSQDDEYAKEHNITAGIGLAAPQIGINKRMFAIYINGGEEIYQYGLINPEIKRTSVKKCYLSSGEGCLSVPHQHEGLVMRYNKVVMSGYDVITDKEIEITAYGYLAIALQHEFDHLNGVLYYDHIKKDSPFVPDNGAIEI